MNCAHSGILCEPPLTMNLTSCRTEFDEAINNRKNQLAKLPSQPLSDVENPFSEACALNKKFSWSLGAGELQELSWAIAPLA